MLLSASLCTNQYKNWDFWFQFCHYFNVLQKGPQNITFLSISFPPKWYVSFLFVLSYLIHTKRLFRWRWGNPLAIWPWLMEVAGKNSFAHLCRRPENFLLSWQVFCQAHRFYLGAINLAENCLQLVPQIWQKAQNLADNATNLAKLEKKTPPLSVELKEFLPFWKKD